MWTNFFPNFTLQLQSRVTTVLEKELQSLPQPPCIHCETVTVHLQSLLALLYFCKCQQSTKYKTGSILVFILLWNLNISNCLEENQFSTLPDFFENCRRKISKKMEFCSAFKISRSVKLNEWRKNQEMAFVYRSRNHQIVVFNQKDYNRPLQLVYDHILKWLGIPVLFLYCLWIGMRKPSTSLFSTDADAKFHCQSKPGKSA